MGAAAATTARAATAVLRAACRSLGTTTLLKIALELGLALGAGGRMTALLHGIQPSDPVALLVAPVLLGAVGLLAAGVAAAKVLRTDPAESLRRD